ncbi:MAG: PAS domain S-box protein [Chloroflexota bacterium]
MLGSQPHGRRPPRTASSGMSGYEGPRPEQAQSEEWFRKIFTYAHDAIFIVDPVRDQILDVNPSACSLLGYSRDELWRCRYRRSILTRCPGCGHSWMGSSSRDMAIPTS